MREAAGDALLVGEVFLADERVPRYLEHLDLVFAFELLFSPGTRSGCVRQSSRRRSSDASSG